jgi:hypothetical protein
VLAVSVGFSRSFLFTALFNDADEMVSIGPTKGSATDVVTHGRGNQQRSVGSIDVCHQGWLRNEQGRSRIVEHGAWLSVFKPVGQSSRTQEVWPLLRRNVKYQPIDSVTLTYGRNPA